MKPVLIALAVCALQGLMVHPALAADTTPPARILDLSTEQVSDYSVTLHWTAPGDDGSTGTAKQYFVVYSTSPILSATFWSSNSAPAPAILPAGSEQSVTVTDLLPATTYYFAVRTRDDAGNTSAISNVPQATTEELVIRFPDDANIINIQNDYGAMGDGVTDDTDAIMTALRENNGVTSAVNNFSPRTIYFPEGVYLVSDTLVPLDSTGVPRNAVRLIGAGVNKTVIKLADNAAGFDNRAVPKYVVQTGYSDTEANSGYGNYIQHLTVDVGSGNPGAVGIRFDVANSGAMEHVIIRSSDASGKYGLGFYTSVGSGYVKDVLIDGFDYGVYLDSTLVNNMVFEDLTVRNQRLGGILNLRKNIQLFDFVSENNPVAVKTNANGAAIILVHGTLNGTGSGRAIDMGADGYFYGRDITAGGFSSIIGINSADYFAGATSIKEWSSHDYYFGWYNAAFSEEALPDYISMNLAVKKTPEYFHPDFSKWANVQNFPGSTDTEKMQAAVDSGAEVIYFPYGTYNIDGTVIIRGNVKKVDFFFSEITGGGTIQVGDVAGDTVVIENAATDLNFEQNGQDTVAVRNIGNIGIGEILTGPNAAGDLFFDNIGPRASGTIGNNIHAWSRQLNRENRAFTNNGATLWLLGDNVESMYIKSTDTVVMNPIKTTDGGKTEIIGGSCDLVNNEDHPASLGAYFVSENAQMSAVVAGKLQGDGSENWRYLINDTADGEVPVNLDDDMLVTISQSSLVHRIVIPLYVSPWGRTPPPDQEAPTAPANLSAVTVSTSQINLDWDAARDNYGVTGYKVYRNGILIASLTATTFSNTGLAAGTSYSYEVMAMDAAGNESARSAAVSAATFVVPTVSLSAAPALIGTGDSTFLGWTTTGVDTCLASGGWTGTKLLMGNETVLPPVTTIYTLTCTGAGGSAVQSVTVSVETLAPIPDINFADSVFSWTTSNADACTASDDWSGAQALSGTHSINVPANGTYTLTCSGAGGTVKRYLTVSTSTSQTVSNKMSIGSQAIVASAVNVRSGVSTSATLLGTQPQGMVGTVTAGPVLADGYWWWYIDFESGPDGWTVENWLE